MKEIMKRKYIYSTIYIYWKNARISGPTQFKFFLFKGQLYVEEKSGWQLTLWTIHRSELAMLHSSTFVFGSLVPFLLLIFFPKPSFIKIHPNCKLHSLLERADHIIYHTMGTLLKEERGCSKDNRH